MNSLTQSALCTCTALSFQLWIDEHKYPKAWFPTQTEPNHARSDLDLAQPNSNAFVGGIVKLLVVQLGLYSCHRRTHTVGHGKCATPARAFADSVQHVFRGRSHEHCSAWPPHERQSKSDVKLHSWFQDAWGCFGKVASRGRRKVHKRNRMAPTCPACIASGIGRRQRKRS